MNIKSIILSGLLFAGSLYGGDGMQKKMSGLSRQFLQDVITTSSLPMTLKSANFENTTLSVKNDEVYAEILLKVKDSTIIDNIKNYGGIINTVAGNIVVTQAPLSRLEEMLDDEGIELAELSQIHPVKMDKSKKSISAENVGGPASIIQSGLLAGENVVVGVVDTGIDIYHPDFNKNEMSRIIRLWDMSIDKTKYLPEGFTWGSAFNQKQITNGYTNEIDVEGHGTHVAGTAAGSGNADPNFRGIAYNSDLMIVKATRSDKKSGFSDGDIIAGCKYIFTEAEKLGKPAVINLSLGGSLGPHDGTSLLDIGVSNLVGPGKIIVAAAGNEGSTPMHAGSDVKAGKTYEIPLANYYSLCNFFPSVCSDGKESWGGNIWATKGILPSLNINAYSYTNSQYSLILSRTISIGGDISRKELIPTNSSYPIAYLDLYTSFETSASTKDNNLFVKINNNGNTSLNLKNYVWTLSFTPTADGSVHLWGNPYMSYSQSSFPTKVGEYIGGDSKYTVGAPATGANIISVGSYNTKNSWENIRNETHRRTYIELDGFSSFSSIGPSRDGKILPTISAPGQLIFSALSSNIKEDVKDSTIISKDGMYIGFQGTSMACPHVTGVVALLLQVKPDLTFDKIINILKNSATVDSYTGTVPNNYFGWGKINAQKAVNYLVTGSDVKYVEIEGAKVYPLPARDFANLELNEAASTVELSVFDISGNKVNNIEYNLTSSNTNKSTIQLNTSAFKAGVYTAECKYLGKAAKFKFMVDAK
jgi:subtilisin family serine protease